jgi:hypothetical protein
VNEANPNIIEQGIPVPPTQPPTSWSVSYDNPGPNVVTVRAVAFCTQLVDAP